MNLLLRYLFFALIVRPLVFILLGLNVRDRHLLPTQGPAVIAANHNSHLDTLVLMSLFPLRMLPRLRPVAAMDYFLRSPVLAWFSLRVIGIIPLDRAARERGEDPLLTCSNALARNEVLILFPEGSRGEPEQMSVLKKGVAHLVERQPQTRVTPVYLHGLGKALPKGEALLVPFFCDVFVGEALAWPGEREELMQQLQTSLQKLQSKGNWAPWE